MDFIRWTVVIYCIAIGSYLASLSGWVSPLSNSTFLTSTSIFIQQGQALNSSTIPSTLSPVMMVFGWEILRTITMLLTLVAFAPIWFTAFLLAIFPAQVSGLAIILGGPMAVVYYFGFAQFIMRMRSPEGV